MAVHLPPSLARHVRRLSTFSVVGGIMTALSTAANVVLLKFFGTPLIPTYVVVYGVSITLSYALNSRFTFRTRLAPHRLALYFGVYLSSMALGVLLLKVYRALLPYPDWVLPILVVPFTALWNYGMASTFMGRREE
jgi:putative flippase GtrA